ncbi:MAG: GNAT family N-acetyltransferase [Blastopirellula sp.]|nr:MAG: GNAT family N-acetyltransferase [Blastopirellula sp.]
MPNQFTGNIIDVDLNNPAHAAAVLELLNLYACDPMGGGKPLSDHVVSSLIESLKSVPSYHGLLAVEGERFIGFATCFLGYSTFNAAPLLNIHDIAVHPDQRQRGIGKALMAAVDQLASRLDCYAVTLEVRADNPARRLYQNCGFKPGDLESEDWAFWKKTL